MWEVGAQVASHYFPKTAHLFSPVAQANMFNLFIYVTRLLQFFNIYSSYNHALIWAKEKYMIVRFLQCDNTKDACDKNRLLRHRTV